jgi:small subunit ribosomal protein S18
VAPAPVERPRGRPSGAGRPERPGRDGDRRRGGGGRFGRRKVCGFCVEKAKAVDYKDPVKLRRYLSDRARIEPRRKTGTCAKHQRWLSVALKRARHLALLPYTPEHVRVTGVFPSRK